MTPPLRNLAAVTTALREGAVLVLPTDTWPGLHARADRPDLVTRIVRIKRRPADQPFLLLAGSLDQVHGLVGKWPGDAAEYANRCWPGPHTLILPARDDAPVSGGDNKSVAVRVPAVPLLRAAIIAVGYPLVSTSVNRTGEPPQTDLSTAARLFAAEVDGWWRPDPKAWGVASSGAAASAPKQPAGPSVAVEPRGSDDRADGPSSLIDLSSWPPSLLRRGRAEPPAW